MSDLVVQLNGLVIQLRQPSISFEDRKKKIGAVCFYLPLIKNRQNLWLVLQELSLSPALFTGNKIDDISLVLYAVDGISYACEKKHEITSPTLTPNKWESEIIQIAYQLPALFGLILASGLVNANVALVPDVIRFVDTVGQNRELLPAVAACLMRAQWSYRFTSDYFHQLPHSPDILEMVVTQLVYTQRSLFLDTPAITSDLGGWSRLISGLLLSQPKPRLFDFLEIVQLFVRTLVARVEDPDAIKQFFFGVVIQLEGIANQVLANVHLHFEERTSLVIGILQVLQPLGFVIEHLGSQFESYQFVLNCCLDTLSSGKTAVRAISVMGERWGFGQTVYSAVDAGDLVLFFEVSEQLMPVISNVDAEQFILPIALRFVGHCDIVSVFESAHSVMLAYLATHPVFRFSKSQTALDYFYQIMQLFPNRLSASQFRTAVGAVMRSVEERAAKIILDELFRAAKLSIPGYVLPIKADTPEEAEAPTLRSALVSALLHAAADNCNSIDLDRWLRLISQMVPEPFNVAVQRERDYLIKDFADMATSLGSETSDVGIKWYFNEGWNAKL